MAINVYPNDQYFHPTFVAQGFQKLHQGELIAERESIIRDLGDADNVTIIEEEFSDFGDKFRPTALDKLEIGETSLFPEVKFSHFKVENDVVKTYGLQMVFSKNVRRNKFMIDFINRGMKRGAYYLAYLLNELTFKSMTNDWSTTPATEDNAEPWNMSAAFPWSNLTSRIPLKDISDMKLMVGNTNNFIFEPDRAYVQKEPFEELNDYLQTTTNVPWTIDPVTNDWNRMVRGIRFAPVHKLSGIPDDTALFLSRNEKPTTIWERTDPNYAQVRLTDNNGRQLPGAYHVRQHVDDDDLSMKIKIWREMVPVTPRIERKSVGIMDTL